MALKNYILALVVIAVLALSSAAVFSNSNIYFVKLHFCKFHGNEYDSLIKSIAGNPKYEIYTLNSYLSGTPDFSKVSVILMHDVDYAPKGAEVFAKVESKRNLRSTFFLRPDMHYYNSSIPFFKNFERNGWEIGYHYDTLVKSNNNSAHALQLFSDEIKFMRKDFNVSSSAPHGHISTKLDNLNLYSDNRAYIEDTLGVRDRYSIRHDIYISDTQCKFNLNKTIETIKGAKPGQLVMLNLHSDWW